MPPADDAFSGVTVTSPAARLPPAALRRWLAAADRDLRGALRGLSRAEQLGPLTFGPMG